MKPPTHRLTVGAILFGLLSALHCNPACAELQAEVAEIRTISWKPPLYHGWPTLARRSNGELLLAFSGGREAHVCPFGRLELMRSSDNGQTWRWPQVIYDSPIDDRDAGIVETSKGTLLVTVFTSLAYQPLLDKAEATPGSWDELKLSEWRAAHHRINDSDRKAEVGMWMLRSTDGGVTWSQRFPVPISSPHGPSVLANGDLLFAGINLWAESRDVGFWKSQDDGQSWRRIASLPVRKDDLSRNYHELHQVECANGRLICHIRNHNEDHKHEILQSESTDGGEHWSEPHPIGVWGLPSHLVRLHDGRLLMSYGYRRPPFGIQVRISNNHGESWSEPIPLYSQGASGDLGYPSTVQCNDGMLTTVWYELLAGSPFAQLRQARWKLIP